MVEWKYNLCYKNTLYRPENLHEWNILLPLHCVFHGIRLLRLMKIGCRETINFFLLYHVVELHGQQHAFGSPFSEGKVFVLKGKTIILLSIYFKIFKFQNRKNTRVQEVFLCTSKHWKTVFHSNGTRCFSQFASYCRISNNILASNQYDFVA